VVDPAMAALNLDTVNYFDGWMGYGASIPPVCLSAIQIAGIDPAGTGRWNGSVFPDRDANFYSSLLEPPIGGVLLPSHRPLCGVASILRFTRYGSTSKDGVLGDGAVSWYLPMASTAGWSRLTMAGAANQGLPVVGFSLSELFNANSSPGVAGAYGVTVPHASTAP
jgi:hypothetical protein